MECSVAGTTILDREWFKPRQRSGSCCYGC